MVHSFDSEIAKEYGILEAILLNNLYYWIVKNQANNKHFYDGKYWTYNSIKAFKELFPYATERKIRTALGHLVEKEILVTGNYNQSTYDRTLWYALTNKGLSVLQKCQMQVAEMSNGDGENVKSNMQKCQMESAEMSNPNGENVQPIPNNKPYSKPNIKPNIYSSCSEQHSEPQEEAQKPFITLPLNTGEEYPVSMSEIEEYKCLYPVVDVPQAMRNMRGWLLANDKKRKTKQGIKRFITSWLSREQDKGGRVQNAPVVNQKPKNKFHNFEQREYTSADWEEIMRREQEKRIQEYREAHPTGFQ